MAYDTLQGNGVDKKIPLYDPAYGVLKQGWLAASLLTGKDFFSLQGSATKIVRLKKVAITLYGDGTNVGKFSVELVRESTTPSTNGSASIVTPAPFDTNDSAATAVATFWPVTVTNGTGSVLLAGGGLGIGYTSVLGGTPVDRLVFDFTTRGDIPPTLRGTSDFLTLRCVGGAPTSSTADIMVEFEEGDT